MPFSCYTHISPYYLNNLITKYINGLENWARIHVKEMGS